MMPAALVALVAFLVPAAALGANASDLLGDPVQDQRGRVLGGVSDLIVDVRANRVVYLIVDVGERYATFPIDALDERLRLARGLQGELAVFDSADEVRFRRATKLIGQPLVHPHPGNTQRIGTIRDFEFDPSTGEIIRVVVATGEGETGFAPGVLAHGRFPPLTYDGGDYLSSEELENLGYLRGPPSSERLRLHDHQW